MKKTLVIGASSKPERPSNDCIVKLRERNLLVEAISSREGSMGDLTFHVGQPNLDNIDTVTLYVGKQNQHAYYDYIIGLKPRRVIFNPGAENEEFQELLRKNQIEPVVGCTLVMLNIGTF